MVSLRLGDASLLYSVAYRCRVDVKYELEPSILRVCKQVHHEAMRVLHEENIFYMLPAYHGPPWLWHVNYSDISPLVRHRNYNHFETCFARVKRWKVVLQSDWVNHGHDTLSTLQNFVQLYKAMSRTRLFSIELAIVPAVLPHGHLLTSNGVPRGYFTLEAILDPLQVLRNVPKLKIRDSVESDLPGRLWESIWKNSNLQLIPYSTALTLDPTLMQDLSRLIAGDSSPPDSMDAIYALTLKYAQCFERFDLFQACMAYGYPYSKLDMKAFTPGHDAKSWIRRDFLNPYYDLRTRSIGYLDIPAGPINTVERNLDQMRELLGGGPKLTHLDIEDRQPSLQHELMAQLKECRDNIVAYLEPQYQRISKAALDRVNILKDVVEVAGSIMGL